MNKLEEKFYEEIDDLCGRAIPDSFKINTTTACAAITKDEMFKFEFFLRTKFRIRYMNNFKDWQKIYVRNEDYDKKDAQLFSPEELIELYFNSEQP